MPNEKHVTAALRHLADLIDLGTLPVPHDVDLVARRSTLRHRQHATVQIYAQDDVVLRQVLDACPDHILASHTAELPLAVYARSGPLLIECRASGLLADELLAGQIHGTYKSGGREQCASCSTVPWSSIAGADSSGDARSICVDCLLTEIEAEQHVNAEAVAQ